MLPSNEICAIIFFQVKDIYLHPDMFSYHNGLLNSAGQLKRKTVEKYFKPQLEDMYAKIQL
jgi:long-subunit acyl-CoA synthetase (AMP-forming)